MKGTLLSVFMLCTVVLAMQAGAGEHTPAKPIDPPYGLARGFGNIMSGWLELPRGIMYENARIPVVGFVVGPVKGAFLTTWREVAGVTDVLCMGLTGKGLYNETVPDFVWDAHWLPSPCEYKATGGTQPRRKPRVAPPCSQTPSASSCSQEAPAGQALATPCNQPRDNVVLEEVKLIEWTTPPAAAATSSPATQRTTAGSTVQQTRAPAAASAAGPRRKVRVTIPFDLGPADEMDQRIKAMDARIADIERRAGIWR